MPNRPWTTITLFTILICVFIPHEIHAQLMITSDTPGPISQLLQLVWEPSSLIRMWTALDQLYNVVLGWRSAARTVIELPFRQGRSMEHVRIQEPRRFNRRQQGLSKDMPHWDWFKKVYEGSSNAPEESGTVESYHPGFGMVAQQSQNARVVDGNIPLNLQQSLNPFTDNAHNSVNIPDSNGIALQNLQQSLSADRNVPFTLKQSPNAFRGNVYNPLKVPETNGNILPNLQQSFSAVSGNGYNSMNAPGAKNNFFLTLQKSLNGLKEAFRNSVNVPFANENSLATLQQSLNSMRVDFPKYLNSPGANVNDLFFLHQLQNAREVSNNIQTDNRYQHLLKSPFPLHHQEIFSNFNTMEFPNQNVDFRRNVKISQPNNYMYSNGHTVSDQNTIKGLNNANVPLMFFNANNVPNSNPETRLRMFLKLMGKLGEMHQKSVKPVDFDDDVNERRSDSTNN